MAIFFFSAFQKTVSVWLRVICTYTSFCRSKLRTEEYATEEEGETLGEGATHRLYEGVGFQPSYFRPQARLDDNARETASARGPTSRSCGADNPGNRIAFKPLQSVLDYPLVRVVRGVKVLSRGLKETA